MPKKILLVELIPSTCHYSNIRSTVTPKDWDKIRFMSYANANGKCEICGQTGLQQGYNHPLECHEIFEYDDINKTQKLVGVVSLCVLCHLTKHIGRAIAMRIEDKCYNQLAKVNNWTPEQIQEHIEACFITHKERSQHQWILDLSILNQDPYNLNIDLDKERVFKKTKWKKKRKRKGRKRAKAKRRLNKRPPKR